MRRILAPLLFVLLLPCTANPQTPANAAPPSTESAQLRATATRLLATGSPDDAVKAADILDKASQIDARNADILKTNAERTKLERPTDTDWKSIIAELTPFFGTLILGITFIFNMRQAAIADQQKQQDAIQQKEDNEGKRFTDAVTLIQKAEGISPAAALLRTFMNGPCKIPARQFGASILLNTKSYDRFQDLYSTVIEPVTQENLTQIIDLLRKVHDDAGPLLTKSWSNDTNDLSRLTAEEKAAYKLLTDERTFLSVRVATALRLPRDPATRLDLSSLGFDSCTLAGVDLRNAIISPGTWNQVNFDGTDLRGITEFENLWLFNSAWWHASHIDKPLLQYLAEKLPFIAGPYYNSPQPVSQKDYDENLARLQALAG